MSTEHAHSLKAGLNRMLEDGYKQIKAAHINTYAFGDIDLIETSINEWNRRNIVKILKPYHECQPDDYCIELLRFIDQKSPIKGYMNWKDE